jgi:hypothetical protein
LQVGLNFQSPYSQDWDGLSKWLESVRTMEMTPGDCTGLLMIVDIGYFARLTYAQIDALRQK